MFTQNAHHLHLPESRGPARPRICWQRASPRYQAARGPQDLVTPTAVPQVVHVHGGMEPLATARSACLDPSKALSPTHLLKALFTRPVQRGATGRRGH